MKRKLNMGLALVILLCCFSPSAMASENDSYYRWIDVLAYGGANGSDNNLVVYNSGTKLTFELPVNTSLSLVDIVIQCTGSGFSKAYLMLDGRDTQYNLSITNLGSNLYRLSGNLGQVARNKLHLYFVTPGVSYFTFLNFRIASGNHLSFEATGQMYASSNGHASGWLNQSTFATALTYTIPDNYPVLMEQVDFTASFVANGWKNYDSVDFNVQLTASSIYSITCMQGDVSLDFTCSYLDVSTGTWFTEEFDPETQLYITQTHNGEFNLTIHMDLSKCNRANSDMPQITIKGNHFTWNPTPCTIRLYSVVGFVQHYEEEADTFFLRRIMNMLTQYFGLGSDTAEEQKNEMQQQAESLQQGVNELNKLEKPDLHTLTTPDLSQTQQGLSVVATVFTHTVNNEYVGFIFLLVAILGIMSYLLYGRG